MKNLTISLAAASLLACASPKKELENVAKDWCLTIRASQILPVYPLSEDIEPGDVFMVPTTLSEQTRIYEERGFLPLDQRVTRLRGLPYDEFYAPGYLNNGFAGAPKTVGDGPDAALEKGVARVAFPSYTFDVTKSGGLELALPIQGVPTGLGLMGASEAKGSVTIRDAYTYGVDAEALITKLYDWWSARKVVRDMLSNVAQQVDEPIYLRIVTRVYLTGGVTVSLMNLDASGAGADAGVSPELKLIDLAQTDPAKAVTASDAHAQVLDSLSGKLSADAGGGSVRFSQASSRSVAMDETFPRPLVIGYRGFDVLVFQDGSLSAPIPSFATLQGDDCLRKLTTGSYHREGGGPDRASVLLDHWIDGDGNYEKLRDWLNGQEGAADPITPSQLIYQPDQAALRDRALTEFNVPLTLPVYVGT